MDRRKKLLFTAISILLGVMLTFSMLEIYCRMLFAKNIEGIKTTDSDATYYVEPSGERHHIPNSTGYDRLWNNQGKAKISINSHGFRGPEIDLNTKSQPIMFLGDSITLGGRLNEDDIFVTKVQKKLKTVSDRLVVVNTGVSDIGLEEIHDIMDDNLDILKPKLVVYCWYLNDNRPPMGFRDEVVYKNTFFKYMNRHDWLFDSYLSHMFTMLRSNI
jgi:hypothetical protein